MLINVKSTPSTDIGRYLVDRPKEAYTIIEGNAKRFDKLAKEYLIQRKGAENSHTSFVLSFKEENLTKEELVSYYLQFKEKMFKNYLPEELEILSVIHWDDFKPHIHCVVVNGSQLYENKELRLFRGKTDIPRNMAIQETINYENNLMSPLNNFNILSLTPTQKARDWGVKKRNRENKRLFDDDVHEWMEETITNVNNYDDFLGLIKRKYGNIEVKRHSAIIKEEGITVSSYLKESQLVLKDHVRKVEIDKKTGKKKTINYVYNSKIFDKRWFNKHIKEIQSQLKGGLGLKDIKFSESRKTLKEYKRILEETTQKHDEHLLERKLGKNWINENLDLVVNENLNYLSELEYSDYTLEELDIKFDKYLEICDERHINNFVQQFGREKFYLQGSSVSLELDNNHEILLRSEKIICYFKRDKIKNEYKIPNNDIDEFYFLLKKIKDNKYKDKLRKLIKKMVILNEIENKEELDTFFNEFGLKVIKSGHDVKKGSYITLENEIGKLAIYDVEIFNLYNKNKPVVDKRVYQRQRDKKIDDFLGYDFIHNLVTEVYLKNSKKYEKMFLDIGDVYDFRLNQSEPLIDSYFATAKDNNIESYRNKNEIVRQVDSKTLEVVKSLDEYETGTNIADMMAARGYIDFSISQGVSDDMKKGMIEQIKKRGYNLSIKSMENESIIFAPEKSKRPIVIDTDILQKVTEIAGKEFDNDIIKEIENKINETDDFNVKEKYKELLDTIRREQKAKKSQDLK